MMRLSKAYRGSSAEATNVDRDKMRYFIIVNINNRLMEVSFVSPLDNIVESNGLSLCPSREKFKRG